MEAPCLYVNSGASTLTESEADFISRAAFHHREGVVISTVTYNDDGVVRPILYRLSLAEMVVPYAAPEHPHPRKFAFDSYVLVWECSLSRC